MIRKRNDISWRFVTRRFSTTYIHEEGFFYLGQEREDDRIILWESKYRTSLMVEGIWNLKNGLPKPNLAGYTSGETRYIYCDLLFLCPDCGRFYFDKDKLGYKYSLQFSLNKFIQELQTIREQDIVSLFEAKKNNNEFDILSCNRKLCLSEKDNNLKLKLTSHDRDTRVEGLTNAIDSYYNENIPNVSGNRSNDKEGFVYIIKAENYVKIGVADNVKERLKQIQGTCPIKVDIVNFWKIHKIFYYENLLHKQYKQFRVHGEWFVLPEEEISFLSAVSSVEDAVKNKKIV